MIAVPGRQQLDNEQTCLLSSNVAVPVRKHTRTYHNKRGIVIFQDLRSLQEVFTIRQENVNPAHLDVI